MGGVTEGWLASFPARCYCFHGLIGETFEHMNLTQMRKSQEETWRQLGTSLVLLPPRGDETDFSPVVSPQTDAELLKSPLSPLFHSFESQHNSHQFNYILIHNTTNPEPWFSILFPILTPDSVIPHTSSRTHHIGMLLMKGPDTNNPSASWVRLVKISLIESGWWAAVSPIRHV